MLTLKRSYIQGVGTYLPEKTLENNYFKDELGLETDDKWITERTGIKKRHISEKDQTTVDMAVEATNMALKNSEINANEINAIVFATTTPDLIFPSCATMLQHRTGCVNAFAFDVQAVCSGFVYATTVANSLIQSGQAENILVVGADAISKIINWKDRNTCVLFGDGAGAVIMGTTSKSDQGIIDSKLFSDGSLGNILKTSKVFSDAENTEVITMNGKEVFRHAVSKLVDMANYALNKNNLSIDDIDFVIPHQANVRIIDAIAERISIPKDKMISTVADHANTSAASIPLALGKKIQDGVIKRGDLLLTMSIGGGMTWGYNLIRY